MLSAVCMRVKSESCMLVKSSHLLSADGESVDVSTEALNELHGKHDSAVVHAVLHVVREVNVVLLHQYKLVADEQVHSLDVVTQVLTTCRQAPATLRQMSAEILQEHKYHSTHLTTSITIHCITEL